MRHTRFHRLNTLGLAFTLFSLSAFAMPSHNGIPDISGVWRWEPHRSTGFRPADNVRVKIEQHGPDLLLTWRIDNKGNEEMQTAYYRIGSDDSRNIAAGSVPVRSSARWQGDVLSINSAPVSGRGEVRSDLWNLLKDGETLLFKEYCQRGAESTCNQVIVFEKLPDNTWGPPQRILPATAVYQNIQIITEPAWRLPSVMMSLTRWLGVDCTFCHTLDEFQNDDKEPKRIARQMFKMVHEINEQNFPRTTPGNFKVTCWTCHHGSAIPETAPTEAELKDVKE